MRASAVTEGPHDGRTARSSLRGPDASRVPSSCHVAALESDRHSEAPVMAGREGLVRTALETPDEIRQSRIDQQVLLFYKAEATTRWTCAVAKRVREGAFLITAYPTDAIKEGVRIWPK